LLALVLFGGGFIQLNAGPVALQGDIISSLREGAGLMVIKTNDVEFNQLFVYQTLPPQNLKKIFERELHLP
jgi:hypothetical protein